MSTRVMLTFSVAVVLCASAVFAVTPSASRELRNGTLAGEEPGRGIASTVWFQGFITDPGTGEPVTAAHDIVAEIFDDEEAGTSIWGPETHLTTSIVDGWFSVELGSVLETLPTFDSPPYYLELTVGGEVLSPRLKLASVPSALRAGAAEEPDADWDISGDDVYKTSGMVGIGTATPTTPLEVHASEHMAILGESSGGEGSFYGVSGEANGTGSLYGVMGTAHGTGSVFGVAGYSDDYGVAGYGDGTGVLGHNPVSLAWGRLGTETAGVLGGGGEEDHWAGYFIGDAYVGDTLAVGTETPQAELDVAGRARMLNFSMPNCALAGRVLTCDGEGNGTWQDPPSGGGDDDWGFSSSDIYLAQPGGVGIGTMYPSARLEVQARTGEMTAMRVANQNPGEIARGVNVEVEGLESTGVISKAQGTSGTMTSFSAETFSNGGTVYGFFGTASCDTGSAYGVKVTASSGHTMADHAVGVHGEATQPSSGSFGLYGVGGTWGVMGKHYLWDGTGALGGVLAGVYGDDGGGGADWAGYFVGDVHLGGNTVTSGFELDVDGTARVTGFRMPPGAAAGRVLTCDSSGNGTWQAATGGSDSDWIIAGNDMYSNVSGSVGVGTTMPSAQLTVYKSGGNAFHSTSTNSGGSATAVYGTASGSTSSGVSGHATSPSGIAHALYGEADVDAGAAYGCYVTANSDSGTATGLRAQGEIGVPYGGTSRGVYGIATTPATSSYGVVGFGGSWGVSGTNSGSAAVGRLGGTLAGVWGNDGGGQAAPWAGYFEGNVYSRDSLAIGIEDPRKPLHVYMDEPGEVAYAMEVENFAGDAGSATGILFKVDSSNENRGKGGIVYERTSTWNRGSFHILQDNNANRDVAELEDAALTVTNDRDVGIGTVTPNSKLEVAGMVHSTSGGFKFPDGTVQTTALTYPYSATSDYAGVMFELTSDAGHPLMGRVMDAIHTPTGNTVILAGPTHGVWARADSSAHHAGWFSGNVQCNGTMYKTAGSFKIDHPLDPENKYLLHSFVESPDMMNVYNGNVVLDAAGEAWVELPDWFEALNADFRYQLTCIGGFAPVFIADKIEGNRFRIAGGDPGMEVSWMVTGVRRDPYAEAHRIRVEEEKPAYERGKYLHPELYGQPRSSEIDGLAAGR
jgi:hypothetical protein